MIATCYDSYMPNRGPGRPPTGRSQSARSAAISPGLLKHRIIEARSLAMHCLIARKIETDRRLLDAARHNLGEWIARYGDGAPRALGEWREILARPWPEIAALITDAGESAARLRQSSPFAGVLTPTERRR